jgi:DNA (cytosine-5)-methyltransferase 1
MGYHRAGFDVTGVDICPQPHYPFTFIQADALDYLVANWWRYDAIHASPPCQRYSVTAALPNVDTGKYPALIEVTRFWLATIDLPYIIENVPGAPLRDPIMLCGTMFNLRVFRHRAFESNKYLWQPHHYKHNGTTGSHRGYSRNTPYICVAGNNYEIGRASCRERVSTSV